MIAASDSISIDTGSGLWVILPFIIFGIIALAVFAGWSARGSYDQWRAEQDAERERRYQESRTR